MKDLLPTKLNLKTQHIPIVGICDGCGGHLESFMHCLWLCDQARSVWLSDSGFMFLVQKQCRSFFAVLKALFSEEFAFNCALFATAACCLWQKRNKLRKHQNAWQLYKIRDRVKELVREF